MLLSYSFWQRRFRFRPECGGPYADAEQCTSKATIVGVLAAAYNVRGVAPGFQAPVDATCSWPVTDKTKPSGNTMKMIGRLKPGATVRRAQTEASGAGKQLGSPASGTGTRSFRG